MGMYQFAILNYQRVRPVDLFDMQNRCSVLYPNSIYGLEPLVDKHFFGMLSDCLVTHHTMVPWPVIVPTIPRGPDLRGIHLAHLATAGHGFHGRAAHQGRLVVEQLTSKDGDGPRSQGPRAIAGIYHKAWW